MERIRIRGILIRTRKTRIRSHAKMLLDQGYTTLPSMQLIITQQQFGMIAVAEGEVQYSICLVAKRRHNFAGEGQRRLPAIAQRPR